MPQKPLPLIGSRKRVEDGARAETAAPLTRLPRRLGRSTNRFSSRPRGITNARSSSSLTARHRRFGPRFALSAGHLSRPQDRSRKDLRSGWPYEAGEAAFSAARVWRLRLRDALTTGSARRSLNGARSTTTAGAIGKRTVGYYDYFRCGRFGAEPLPIVRGMTCSSANRWSACRWTVSTGHQDAVDLIESPPAAETRVAGCAPRWATRPLQPKYLGIGNEN
jgi:hypothetical protein